MKWMYVHLFGQIFVVLWTTYFYQMVIKFFIPLSGRSGDGVNPEFLIGLITIIYTILITSFLVR